MPIPAKYVHTNLIARDWKGLVRFYSEVFGYVWRLAGSADFSSERAS